MLIVTHTFLGAVALAAGAWNLMTPKGTRQHRLVGWVYVGSMAGLILTSFAIFDLFGGFGPFHALSLVSGTTLALAMYFPLRREHFDNWLEHHYMWITWSYVGLVMATGSHLFPYGPPGWPFWARAVLYWGVPCLIGASLIFGWRTRMLARFQEHGEAQRPL